MRKKLPKPGRGAPAARAQKDSAACSGRANSKASAPSGASQPAQRGSKRAVAASERREAIIAAGLDEFTAKGFAATRLDDVAKRAGVAKGTIYLHFADKEVLFQELVRTALGPLIARMANPPSATGSARVMMEGLAHMFATEVVGTRRGDILRMLIAEGTRFPSLADFYYREVVAHGIAAIRRLIENGIARGEIRNPGLVDFPQLLVAPVIIAVIWQGLFGRLAPLDVAAMLRVHLGLIFDDGSKS